MTHEKSHSSEPFANSYPVPSDQFKFEIDLREDFEKRFPGSEPILYGAIEQVAKKSSAVKSRDETREVAADLSVPIDPLSYIEGGTEGYSTLLLTMPVEHSVEQIAQMSLEEKTEAGKTHTGTMIVGELPSETVAMLNGIYSLIGAETIRDDKAAGEPTGTVLRMGIYHGHPVYVAEDYMEQSYYSGKPLISVRVAGPVAGEIIADDLNESQFRELAEAMGGDGLAAARLKADPALNITNANYHRVASVMREAYDTLESGE